MHTHLNKKSYWLFTLPFLFMLGTAFAKNTDYYNGVVFAKYVWFYFCMAVMLPVIPFLKHPKPSLTDWLLFSFGAMVLIVALLSGNPVAYNKLVLFVLLLILYWLLRCLLNYYSAVAGLIKVGLITTALIECILGLLQLYEILPSNHSLFKITGSFFNPGPFSGYVGMIVPLALHEAIQFSRKEAKLRRILTQLFRNKKSLKDRWHASIFRWLLPYVGGCLSILTVLTALMVLPAAMSRAAWVGVLGGSLIVLQNNQVFRLKIASLLGSRRKRSVSIMLVLVLTVGVFVGFYFVRPASVDGRILIWKHGINAIIEQPSGVGVGKMGTAIGKVQADFYSTGNISQEFINSADVPFYAFNEYIQIGVESGVLSLLLFLALLGVVMKQAYKTKQHGLFGSLVSLCLFAFFSYPFSVLPFIIVFVSLMALSQTKESTHQSSKVAASFDNKTADSYILLRSLPINLILIGMVTACLIDRYPTIQAWKTWKESKTLFNADLFEEATVSMEPLYMYLNDQPEFLFDYACSLSKAGYYKKSNMVLERCMAFCGDPMLYNVYGENLMALNKYKEAESSFKYAYNIAPNRLYPLYLLTRMYIDIGDSLNAKQTYEQFNNHTIISPSMAIEEMKDSLKINMATM